MRRTFKTQIRTATTSLREIHFGSSYLSFYFFIIFISHLYIHPADKCVFVLFYSLKKCELNFLFSTHSQQFSVFHFKFSTRKIIRCSGLRRIIMIIKQKQLMHSHSKTFSGADWSYGHTGALKLVKWNKGYSYKSKDYKNYALSKEAFCSIGEITGPLRVQISSS